MKTFLLIHSRIYDVTDVFVFPFQGGVNYLAWTKDDLNFIHANTMEEALALDEVWANQFCNGDSLQKLGQLPTELSLLDHNTWNYTSNALKDRQSWSEFSL